jgi:hypothetical protein
LIDNSYLNFDYAFDNSIEKYENSVFSKDVGDKYLKSIPKLKLGIDFKTGLFFDNTQSQFQKITAKLPQQYSTYRKMFSGILSDRYSSSLSFTEDTTPKETEDKNNKINLYKNRLSLDLINLHYADAFTIGNKIFSTPNKMNLSSDRGKALLIHEITHIVQQKRDDQSGKDAKTITLSKYLDMEKEALNAENAFLRLSVLRKLNKEKNLSFDYHSDRNIGDTESFGFDNEKQSPTLAKFDLPLVHPNVAKIFKQIVKEDFTELKDQGSQFYNNTGNSTYLSNSVDKSSSVSESSSASKFTNEPIFLATEGRSAYPPAAMPAGGDLSGKMMTPSINWNKEPVDLNNLAEQVYDLISKRLVLERSRRGIS